MLPISIRFLLHQGIEVAPFSETLSYSTGQEMVHGVRQVRSLERCLREVAERTDKQVWSHSSPADSAKDADTWRDLQSQEWHKYHVVFYFFFLFSTFQARYGGALYSTPQLHCVQCHFPNQTKFLILTHTVKKCVEFSEPVLV